MSIKIDEKKCTGCGKCRSVCPGSLLIKNEKGKTINRSPRDCWGCTACLKECSHDAIKYFLGADIGGRGTWLSTRRQDNYLHWIFTNPVGEKNIITINSKESNKY